MVKSDAELTSIRVMAIAPAGHEVAVGVDAESMYRDHYESVMRYVRARVATREVAEDLVADVFCRALGAAGAYRAMRETPLPWLYRIAAHRVADHYRRQRPSCGLDAAAEVVSPEPGPDDLVLRQVAISEIWEVSQALPKTQRRALWLRYGRQLELREIALLMGKTVEAVKLLIHRAIKHLRAALVAELPSRDGSLSASSVQTSA
jgi:RNA polymerase sigma-70 factor (ECF subfamily)